MRTVSALEVRKKFGSILDLVAERRVPVAITRGNRRLVVMVPAEEYEARRLGREARLRLATEKISSWKRRHARQLRGVNPARLVREIRDAR
jgi:prevent-host-death family protein